MVCNEYQGSKTQPTWAKSVVHTVTVSQVAIGANDFDVDVAETLVADWYVGQSAYIIKDGVAGGGALEGRPMKVTGNDTGNVTFSEKVGAGAGGLTLLTGDRIAIETVGLPVQDAAGGVTNLLGEIISSPLPRLARDFYEGYYHGSAHMPARDQNIPIANKYETSFEMDVFNGKILGQFFGSVSDDTADYEAGGLSTTITRELFAGEDEIPLTSFVDANEGTDIIIKGGAAGKPEVRHIDYVYESIAFTLGGAVANTEIVPGDLLLGAGSAETCYVVRTELTAGSWAAGTAAGVLVLRTKSGALVAEALGTPLIAETLTIGADSAEYALKVDEPLEQFHTSLAAVEEVDEDAGVPETVIAHTLEVSDCAKAFIVEQAFINSRTFSGHDIVMQFMGLMGNSLVLKSTPGSTPLQASLGVQGLASRDKTIGGVRLEERSSVTEVGFDAGIYKYTSSVVTVNGVEYGEAGDFSLTLNRSIKTTQTHQSGDRPYYKAGDPFVHFPEKVSAEYSLGIPLRNRTFMDLLRDGTEFTATFRFDRAGVGDYLEVEMSSCYIKGPDIEIPEPGEIPQVADATCRKMKITVYDFIPHY